MASAYEQLMAKYSGGSAYDKLMKRVAEQPKVTVDEAAYESLTQPSKPPQLPPLKAAEISSPYFSSALYKPPLLSPLKAAEMASPYFSSRLTQDYVDSETERINKEIAELRSKIDSYYPVSSTYEEHQAKADLQSQIRAKEAEIAKLKSQLFEDEAVSIYYTLDKGTRQLLDRYPALTATPVNVAGSAMMGNEEQRKQADLAILQSKREVQRLKDTLAAKGYNQRQIERLLAYVQQKADAEELEMTRLKAEKHASEHPVIASIESVGTNLLSGFGVVDALAQNIKNVITGYDIPVNYAGGPFQMAAHTDAIRGQVQKDIAEATPKLNLMGQNVLGQLYGVGMSLADLAAATAVTGGFSSAGNVKNVGKAFQSALKSSEAGILALFGTRAATSALTDAAERGATDLQALIYGIMNGAAEVVFEKVSLDSLISMSNQKTIRSLVKNALKQSTIEGSEEVFTTIANTMSDLIIMGDKSDIISSINEDKDVALDWFKGLAWDYINGAISGGVSGGVTSTLSYLTQPPAEVTRDSIQPQDAVLNTDSSTTPVAQPATVDITKNSVATTQAQSATKPLVTYAPGSIGEALTKSDLPEGVGAASAGFGGTVERGFSKNVATDSSMQADIREDFQLAPEMYNRLGNKETLAKAQSEFNKGVGVALAGLNQRIGKGKITPSDVPLSRLIANSLAQSGDLDGARAVISDVAVLLTEAGQLGQAARILRNADPISVEITIQKSIDKINAELEKRGSKYRVALTAEEIDMIQSTDFSQEGAYELVYSEIARRIGAEMPSTLWQKLTEVRRIAMLLNPKTQLRNIAGNVMLALMRKGSERLAGGIQDVLVKMGAMDKADQTRTFTVSKESKTLAAKLFELNEESIVSGSDRWDMNSLIRQYRKYFGKSMAGKAADAVRAFTYNLLQMGDLPFLKSAFIDNAAQHIEAQGYKSIDEIPVSVVERATQQALEATFRDASALARLLNQTKAKGGLGGKALDILFPFTTTPINIAKRTYEYSPLGVIKLLSDIITHKDGATIIDDITKTLTGSAVVALGYLLRSLGVITGAEDKDPDKRAFDRATGKNPYSFAGIVSYDWLLPAGPLLAMGAAIFDVASQQEGVVDKIVNTVISSGDAYLNMSFFQNILDLFRGYKSPTENVLTTIATSGVSQFAPSLFGAVARTLDPTVRTSYTGGNVVQDALASVQQKTPFASQQLPPSVNIKGEASRRIENPLLRGLQEIINPATVNTNKANQVDALIQSLYKATNDKGVFPRVAPYNIEGINLTGGERAQFQKTLGKTTYDILMAEMNSKSFTALSDEQKAKVVKEIISFAYDSAKREYAENKGQDYSSNYDEESQIKDVGKYFIYNTKYGNTAADNRKARIALLSDTEIKPDQQKLIYNALFSDDYYTKYEQFGKPSGLSAKTFITLMQSNTKKADMISAAERSNLSEKQVNALLEAKGWKPDYYK